MYPIISELINQIPSGWHFKQAHIGSRWVLCTAVSPDGQITAGMASHLATAEQCLTASQSQLVGNLNKVTSIAKSENPALAAVGIAAINAYFSSQPQIYGNTDAADWLAEVGKDKHVALIGRFPFIEDEIRPVAKRVSVFELVPQSGEYSPDELPRILPTVDYLAITGSTFTNQSIETILPQIPGQTQVIILGATTPLTPILFNYGADILAGVQVNDISSAVAAIKAGTTFRKIPGLTRVSIKRSP